ncbi:calpain-8-like [Synchiropus splendidus]|uniref:calpain-8-like n=1 Tax=Synchiropus splendidus TaxID=270530 RepID=UPI00237DCA89|nr:calpain-8-like [Synchiropus splendidus]
MSAPGVCMNIMRTRNKQEGLGTRSNPDRFANQDYLVLKKACLMQRLRFVDDMFPPDKTSIGQGLMSPAELARVEWLRPAKIAPFPAFISEGVSRFDFGQGIVSDCWFLASIGALTFQEQVFKQVVPVDQEFDEDYCGLFHFRFWRFGSWIDVVIDDKLPTIDGRLIFVHSNDPNEFWPALLEKAYAKVCGSYMDMNMGSPEEAMMDFTGGVHVSIPLSEPPADMWELMCRAGNSVTLMGCGTPQGDTFENTVLPNGVVLCHAYTVTGVKQVVSCGKPVRLVRLWNPWGRVEWNGDWSDRSPLWKTVSPEVQELCLKATEDGEFWMTLEDFCKSFIDLDICGLCPDFLGADSDSHWKTSSYDGRWVAGTTAGGCINYADTFWTNPQFRITVEGSEEDVSKNMLVYLMQRPDKRHRRLVKPLHIGFCIYAVRAGLYSRYRNTSGKFPQSFFKSHAPVVQTSPYMNGREVMKFFRLRPGDYLIVPTTYNPNETASFLLTIYSREETHGYDNSGSLRGRQEPQEIQLSDGMNGLDDEVEQNIFTQYCNQYEELDAERLQNLLNETFLTGIKESGGFSIEACRSMVALMDTSINGTLDFQEFSRLWRKLKTYKEVYFRTDVSQTGTLSLQELRNAIMESGMTVSDSMLNLLALRYGAASGHMTLESFIGLIIRLDCMFKVYKHLSDGMSMELSQSEWMCLSMYT